jgi:hypothetical protein
MHPAHTLPLRTLSPLHLRQVLGKRLVPLALQPLVLQLARHMLATLRLLTRDGGAALETTSEAFLCSVSACNLTPILHTHVCTSVLK